MNPSVKDFDRFLAEREPRGMALRILGRECRVPSELPWWYVMKVERMLREGEPISGEENARLLEQLMTAEDFAYVTGHPEFRASWFWEIIAFGWLRGEAPEAAKPGFQTEDDLRVRETREGAEKNESSAPSISGRTLRLTSNERTASTCSPAT